MNGRLAALAEQAGYFIKFERTGNDVTVVHTKEPGTDGDLALFAELIVWPVCMNTSSSDYGLHLKPWFTNGSLNPLKNFLNLVKS